MNMLALQTGSPIGYEVRAIPLCYTLFIYFLLLGMFFVENSCKRFYYYLPCYEVKGGVLLSSCTVHLSSRSGARLSVSTNLPGEVLLHF